MYYTTDSYSLHDIGLTLHPTPWNFIRYEDERGHPLDWAGQLWQGYALCFTQKITAKNLIPCIPAFPRGIGYIQHQKLFPQHTPHPHTNLRNSPRKLAIETPPIIFPHEIPPPPILFLQKRVHSVQIGATNRYP